MDAAYTGRQITERRKKLGMTQKNLAKKLHVTDKAVSKWERGLNFPDLGLMEALAMALDTTPACLLGLERANQDEIVSSLTLISSEQLEDAQKDMRRTGWGCIAAAVLLTLAYSLFGNDVQRTQNAYLILHCVIAAAALAGVYVLFKYGEIKKWEPGDLLVFYGGLLPILIYLGIQFFTGYAPHPALALCLIASASSCIQLLFCRIMRPWLIKALPLILTTSFTLWHSLDGTILLEFVLPAVCCLAVFLICLIRKQQKKSQP